MYEGDQQASSLWTFVVAVLQAVLPYGRAPRRTAALGRLLRSDWSDQDGLPSWNSKMDTVSNRGPPESSDVSAITKSPAASILPGVTVGSWGKAPSRLVGKGVSRFQREEPRTVAAYRGQIRPPMGSPATTNAPSVSRGGFTTRRRVPSWRPSFGPMVWILYAFGKEMDKKGAPRLSLPPMLGWLWMDRSGQ